MKTTLTPLLLATCLAAAQTLDQPLQRTFHDNGAELANPGMGWVLHYYDNSLQNYGARLAPENLLPDWPGLTQVYLRLPWSAIEPQENVFNWAVLDTPMQRFRERGLKTSLRITCSETGFLQATPKWVRDAGAKGDCFKPGKGRVPDAPNAHWEPHFDDPIFLDKLDHLLAKLAARYDGHPDIELIDIGSYGVWGEGHTWCSTFNAFPPEVVKRHVELHRKHFRKTPILTQDDFLSRPGYRTPAWNPGGTTPIRYDLPLASWTHGKTFTLAAQLPNARGLHADSNGRITVATLAIAPDGTPTLTPTATLPQTLPQTVDYALTTDQLIRDPVNAPHACKVQLLALTHPTFSGKHIPNLLLLDDQGKTVAGIPLEKEDDDLNTFMANAGCGFRDDSIMVAGLAYFHAQAAQAYWRNAPIYIESEHYGPSKQRGCWGDGSSFLNAIRDYHASYASIHWWPEEFLAENRKLVRDINRQIGYRLLPQQVSLDARLSIRKNQFQCSIVWQNVGVAPPYTDLYPCITLRNQAGGIAAVFTDDTHSLRTLPVALDAKAETRTLSLKTALPPHLQAGTYNAYLSVGDQLGKPLIQLPIDGDDGSRRYLLGQVTVTADYAISDLKATLTDQRLDINLTWRTHESQPETPIHPFVHLDTPAGTIAKVGSYTIAPDALAHLNQPGDARGQLHLDLPPADSPHDHYTVWTGLWFPKRMGRADERLRPDHGADNRVLLGHLRKAPDGSWSFSPHQP
ncbi:MAG: DUF4832 domain-containing protein [Oligosphaeraceae bacterium]